MIESLGVDSFDICFVCISTNFQSSLEITSQLKEHGAKHVISRASRDIQAKFLLRNGADAVIYPERDVAYQAAVNLETVGVIRADATGSLSLNRGLTRAEAAEMLCGALEVLDARETGGLFRW